MSDVDVVDELTVTPILVEAGQKASENVNETARRSSVEIVANELEKAMVVLAMLKMEECAFAQNS